MFKWFAIFTTAIITLSACASQPTSTPLPTTTAAPIPSTTPTPMATATQVVQVITAQVGTAQAGPASTVVLSRLPSITPNTSPQILKPDASGNLTVTLDDSNKSVILKVGQRFLLNLGAEFEWAVDVADQSIVSRVVNISVVRGAQGVYEAHKIGRTALNAVGDLPCRKSQPPCMAPSRLFKIDIVVQ